MGVVDASESARAPDGAAQEVPIRWRSFPLVDDFPKSALLVALLLAVAAGVAVSLDGIGLGVLSLVLLSLSVARYFYPTGYELSEPGLCTRSWLGRATRPWSAFANYYVHDVGVHLSPFGRPSVLDPFRGTFVRFTGNRDAVVGFVRRHVPSGTSDPIEETA